MSLIDIQKLEQIIKVKINNTKLFETALTHRSYLNEHPEYENPSNERLEFLGDAVLELIVSQKLYENFPGVEEGTLTNYRSAIVCTTSLAEESKKLNYGELLLMALGEEKSGGRDREYILANTFEAVLGALYLDNNLQVCEKFIQENLLYKINKIIEDKLYKDFKSLFQEIAQEKKGITPEYRVVDAWGADHEKTFKVGVYLGEEEFGVGEGKSKQKAQQDAAFKALDKLKNL